MKFKKISNLISLLISSAIVAPVVTSCTYDQNYQTGSVVDPEDNNSTTNNNTQTVGNLPDEFKTLNSSNFVPNVLNVLNEVSFLDYQKNSTVDGNYLYIHERGDLTEFKVNAYTKRNYKDFLNNFNFNSYLNDTNIQNKPNKPTKELFLNDIYSWFNQIYISNNKVFDVSLVENNTINYVKDENNTNDNGTISFDVSFKIKNFKSTKRSITIFNHKFDLEPNKETIVNIKTDNQQITNVINIYNSRYFYGWQIPSIELTIDNKTPITINNFNPTTTQYSNAFALEFINLTTNENVDIKNDNDAQEFMSNLTSETIEDNIVATINRNTDNAMTLIPKVSQIFDILKEDPTLGEFIYKVSDPLTDILKDYNVLPTALLDFLNDLMKSIHLGDKGILDLVVIHKAALSDTLKVMLAPILGSLTDLVDTILTPIKPGMTKDDVEGFKKLLNMFSFDQKIKDLILEIIDMLMGTFDSNGVVVNQGNPYILDLIDYLLVDSFDKIYDTFLTNTIDKQVLQMIIGIYQKFTERDKDANNRTDISNGSVNFHNKVITKLLEGTGQNATNGSSWLIESLIDILNLLGIKIDKTSDNLIYELLNQAYTLDANKTHVNYDNFMIALNEISRALQFLSNKDNFVFEGEFVPFDDGSNVKYNNVTYEYDFNYNYKIKFNNPFTFELDKIFDALPQDLYLEVYKLTGQEWIHINLKDAAAQAGIPTWMVPDENIGIYTKNRYARANLNRLIYRMIPRNLSFETNDSYNMDYSTSTKKLFYNQVKNGDSYYRGFSSIMDVTSYFNQADPTKGIITNTMANAFDKEDYEDVKDDHILDKPYGNNTTVTVSVKTESGASNKQSEQNITSVKELVQKLLVNKMTYTVNLNGYDANQIIDNPKSNDAFYKNKTFKWNDLDLSKEIITTSSFKSTKYDQYYNMFQYQQLDETFDYSYISDTSGNSTTGTFNRNVPSFSDESIEILKKDLFTIGSGLSTDDYMVSIKPLTNFKISKIINVKGGARLVNLIDFNNAMSLNLSFDIDMMVFQARVMTNTPLLDLSSVSRNGDSFSLSSYKYSNSFEKLIFVPRIKVVLPNI